MALEIPEIRNLKTWEDAFQYPVPTTRAIEKRLKNGLTENHDKLRTLVGYRDLLGTARTIIEIDGRLHEVEDLTRETDHNHFALSSKLATLKASLAVITRLLKSNGSSLLIAKLLVLGRIFEKSLTEENENSTIDKASSKIAQLRQRLLKAVDKRLSGAAVNVNDLVEDLSAFCLVTSSGPLDALKHFLAHRLKAIQQDRGVTQENVGDRVQTRLDIFVDTIKQSKAIFPNVISSALRKLSAQPLLKDSSIRSLDELDPELYGPWLDEPIQNYTPWTRHGEIDSRQASQQLQSWTIIGLASFTSKIEADLPTSSQDAAAVDIAVSTRRRILESWLSARSVRRGVDSPNALDKIRHAFLRHCSKLVGIAAKDLLDSVTASLTKLDDDYESKGPIQSSERLWDISSDGDLLADGGMSFREAVIRRRLGTTDELHTAGASCKQCIERLEAMHSAFKAMRDTRWDDDYDDSDEERSEPDESTTTIQNLLSRQDPDALLQELRHGSIAMVKSLESKLSAYAESPASCSGVFLLRMIRELRSRLPVLYASLECTAPGQLFAQETVAQLHSSLAASVVDSVLATQRSICEKLTEPLSIRALWEGSPPLPLQISPVTFKLLRALVKEMERVGFDLWNPEAVQELKRRASALIVAQVQRKISDTIEERGIGPSDNSDESSDHTIMLNGNEKQIESDTSEDVKTATDRGHNEQDTENAQDVSHNAQASNASADTADQTEDDSNEPESKPESPSAAPKQPKVHPDNLIQLFFDTLYLQQALHPTSSSQILPQDAADRTFAPLTEDLTKWCGIADAEKARLQKNAKDYWRRTYLLFGLLCNG
ncbi:MAG: hypothetical protein Q9162_005381 [Coniocarpon cinnabarinum]